jgi:hypothetical protein
VVVVVMVMVLRGVEGNAPPTEEILTEFRQRARTFL